MDERKLKMLIISRDIDSKRISLEEGLKRIANIDKGESLVQRMERLMKKRERDRERRAKKKEEMLLIKKKQEMAAKKKSVKTKSVLKRKLISARKK